MVRANELTATHALRLMRAGDLSVEALAQACLERIRERDDVVRAWAYLDPELVLRNARELDKREIKGPLHGIPIAVKDVILTEDMPTEHNSPLYKGSFPAVDAGCVKTLRAAGALIFGKTDTTEFASVTRGGTARHPLDPGRTPGGSSSGSAAVVADFQATIALGTQTAGSTIRPGSFCGIYAMKPTWGAINREGLKMLALSLDTLGLYARSAEDLDLLADVFALEDRIPVAPFELRGARIASCRSPAWDKVEPATRDAFERGIGLLREAGADVEPLELPDAFDSLGEHHATVMAGEAHVSFLSEIRAQGELLHDDVAALAKNSKGISKSALLTALDAAAACRVTFDAIAAGYDAVLTPSARGEAPEGTKTGEAALNAIWTLLHVPVVQIPGFKGPSGMPVGLSLTSPRYTDRRLLQVTRAIGPLFESSGTES
ncbi:amidase [Bradyrhizobium sp.]|uniref:amidase n=1 Tax=Bradyrhizobium sp. TaxID=376 RepID=UPI003C6F054A